MVLSTLYLWDQINFVLRKRDFTLMARPRVTIISHFVGYQAYINPYRGPPHLAVAYQFRLEDRRLSNRVGTMQPSKASLR